MCDPRIMDGIQQFHQLLNLCQTIYVSRKKKSAVTIIWRVNIEVHSSKRMQVELPHGSKESKNFMQHSQPQRYFFYIIAIFTIARLWFHFDSYFLFTSYLANWVTVSIFLDIFCIICILCSGYDADLILSVVKPRHGKITIIPNSIVHYTSFAISDVTFVDSYQFMLSSLDKLSNNLS